MNCKYCHENNLLICLCEEEEVEIDITDFIKESYEEENFELLMKIYVYKEAKERNENNKGKYNLIIYIILIIFIYLYLSYFLEVENNNLLKKIEEAEKNNKYKKARRLRKEYRKLNNLISDGRGGEYNKDEGVMISNRNFWGKKNKHFVYYS